MRGRSHAEDAGRATEGMRETAKEGGHMPKTLAAPRKAWPRPPKSIENYEKHNESLTTVISQTLTTLMLSTGIGLSHLFVHKPLHRSHVFLRISNASQIPAIEFSIKTCDALVCSCTNFCAVHTSFHVHQNHHKQQHDPSGNGETSELNYYMKTQWLNSFSLS